MRNLILTAAWLSGLLWAQTILVDGTGAGSFEGAPTGCPASHSGWTIVNGSEVNRWAVGTGAGATHGSQAIYITDNCGANPPPHNYTNCSPWGCVRAVHFYRDITLPPGEPYLTISFRVRVMGENNYDYLDVFVAPTTVTPTAGSEVSDAYRVARYQRLTDPWSATPQTAQPCNPYTGTVRVIFSWRYDGSVTNQPPAALDQIHITSSATAPPPCNLGSGVTNIGALAPGTWNSGPGTTCGAGNDLTSGNTVVCGSTGYLGGEDRVFVFTPTQSGAVTISLTHSNPGSPWFGLMLYAGCPTCGSCLGYSQSASGPYNFCASVTAGQTYYLVVDHFTSCASYDNISITLTLTSSPPVDACVGIGYTNIGTLSVGTPYNSGPGTTCCAQNDLTSSNSTACGSTSYLGGEDYVYIFTPASNGMVSISLTHSNSWSPRFGLMLYQGCPKSGGTCVAHSQSAAGPYSICANVTAGQTYYLVVDHFPAPSCANYDNVSITLTSSPSVDACVGTGYTNIGTLSVGTPYNSGPGTTCCAQNDLTSSNSTACGSTNYLGGEDYAYIFTPASNGVVNISLTHSNTSSPYFGLMLYQGCPKSGGTCVARSQSAAGPYNICANVTAGQTYYLVVDHWPSPSCANYDNVSIALPSPSWPDLCSAPLFTTYPVLTTGTTAGAPSLDVRPSCAGSSCIIIGRWYRFVATAANMTVHVAPGSLTDPAVAVFSAPSCSGPFTEIACNDDGTGCESSPRFARVSLTGLTVGQTYYVAVFAGAGGGSGDFTLAIWPTSGTPPSQYGQDCDAVAGDPATGPIIPCGATMSFGAPGFVGSGIVCDLPYPAGGCPASCLLSGERNIVWFRLPISANGNLSFSISPSANVDYDWTLYRIDNVANPCQAIRTGAINPVRCSYDVPPSCNGSYSTGVACGTPACASGTCEGAGGQGWLSCVSVNAGEVYLLGISNYSNSFPGFSVDFGSSPIDYQTNPSIWTGGAGSTAWNNATNWGGCGIPNACTQDVFIYGGASNQPLIAAAETWTVRNITIPAGASLTVNGTLRICGHLTVNGILDGTGWIEFIGNATYPVQEIRGILTGAAFIPNLRLSRSTNGTVRLMTDVEAGNVQITNTATHTLDFNGKTLFVSGNFNNQTGANTVLATAAGSTLVFNGSSAQTYSDPDSDPFQNVVVNQSAVSTVTLNNTVRVTGTLTLTQGLLVAPTALTREVRVENPAPAAVNAGNANSFVAGYLRRYLNNTGGSYDFPVGLQTPQRYSRISFDFGANNPGVHNLLARFDAWTPPTPSGTPITECGANYGTCTMLNNGYWTVNAYQSNLTTQITGTSGLYTATLYNTGYTTCAGAAQFGVLKNTSASATTGSNWFIQNQGCYANGSAAVVSRPGMSGFSFFGTGQSTTPLPITLVDFRGQVLSDGSHELSWQVNATAGSSVRHYVLEAGTTWDHLSPLATLGPDEKRYRRANPPFGRSFYRLRIHSEDGTELYSSVVELARKPASTASQLDISVYPNPAQDEVYVSWRTDANEPLTIRLYNSLGQTLTETAISKPEASGTQTLSLRTLSKGLYLVEVRQGERLSLVRLVVE